MTPEELDEARAKEAYREWCEDGCQGDDTIDVAAIAARLARENWTPPEPVDPDLLAFRTWGERRFGLNTASAYRLGDCDDTAIAEAYLAGRRMAREQERERARPLVERFSALVERVYDDARRRKRTGVNASEMISARVALAKYEEGGR